MEDGWDFWRFQLAGGLPETTPGTPHSGFYLLRERHKRRRQDGERKIGTMDMVKTYHWPCAIWLDETGWHCVVTRVPRDKMPGCETTHTTRIERVDSTFSICCRDAITHDDYLAKVKEIEDERSSRASA